MSRWVGGDGYEVEPIRLDDGPVIRVRQYGYLVVYASTVAEVARHIDLAELCEVTSLPAPSGSHSCPLPPRR